MSLDLKVEKLTEILKSNTLIFLKSDLTKRAAALKKPLHLEKYRLIQKPLIPSYTYSTPII